MLPSQTVFPCCIELLGRAGFQQRCDEDRAALAAAQPIGVRLAMATSACARCEQQRAVS